MQSGQHVDPGLAGAGRRGVLHSRPGACHCLIRNRLLSPVCLCAGVPAAMGLFSCLDSKVVPLCPCWRSAVFPSQPSCRVAQASRFCRRCSVGAQRLRSRVRARCCVVFHRRCWTTCRTTRWSLRLHARPTAPARSATHSTESASCRLTGSLIGLLAAVHLRAPLRPARLHAFLLVWWLCLREHSFPFLLSAAARLSNWLWVKQPFPHLLLPIAAVSCVMRSGCRRWCAAATATRRKRSSVRRVCLLLLAVLLPDSELPDRVAFLSSRWCSPAVCLSRLCCVAIRPCCRSHQWRIMHIAGSRVSC